MLKFKLVPFGKKHQVHYRLCVVPQKSRLSGQVVEIVGHYHPHQNHQLSLNIDRIKYWTAQGVQPTDRVRKLVWKNLSLT